jgi:hypothetical protein
VRRVLALLLFVLPGASAQADGPYDGRWTASPARVRVTIDEWGDACGPRPESTTMQRGAGPVTVRADGNQLVFDPGGRTDRCWSENPAVRRISGSVSPGRWVTRCRSPSSDSRQEAGTYTIRAVDAGRIEFTAVSRYDWRLTGDQCRATITTSRRWTRRVETPDEPEFPPEEPGSTPRPRLRRCGDGDELRLVARPPRDVGPGEPVCLTVRLEGEGCRGRAVGSPDLTVRSGPARVEAGCLVPRGDGPVEVRVRAGALEQTITLEVSTGFANLIAQELLEDEAAPPGFGEAPEGGSRGGVAGRAAAREGPATPPMFVLVGAAGLLGLLLVALALFLLGRRPERGAGEADEPASPPEPTPPRGGPSPPTTAAPRDADPEETADTGEAMICPTCRRGFAPGTATCSVDGTSLVTYAAFRERAQADTKVCPTCGTTYPAHVTFCGKDGTPLRD